MGGVATLLALITAALVLRWWLQRLNDRAGEHDLVQEAAATDIDDDPTTFTLPNGVVLHNIHSADRCTAPCVIHTPTLHSMRDWPLHWRDDRRIFERICPHGIGHPDPDQSLLTDADTVHGCDGCCRGGPA